MPEASFRFYEELNDFLPARLRKRDLRQRFAGNPTVKDVIEGIGVPHTEIDLILVDGESADFDRRLAGGERVAVYPVFERMDIQPVLRLRPAPLRDPRFLCDVHLARLTRYLRMAGIDSRAPRDTDDAAIVGQSLDEGSTVLTRDRGLLKRARLQRGYWVRADRPRDQLVEVIRAFQLEGRIRPFSRCMVCNSPVETVEAVAVAERLPSRVRLSQSDFWRCTGCGRIYWRGSHFRRMRMLLARLGLERPTQVDPGCR